MNFKEIFEWAFAYISVTTVILVSMVFICSLESIIDWIFTLI